MQATKLLLTTCFQAFYLIGQTKTGISSLELSRHLGVKYDTAWLLHNKILRAMTDREDAYVLRGEIQMDDAFLGGERPGGKAGRGSENKIPIVAAVSLSEAGHPIHAEITPVAGFSSEAVGAWARENLAPGCAVISDGLAGLRSVTTAGSSHEAIVTGGKHPNDLPQFRWNNTLLGNLKTSLSGTFHAFNFDKLLQAVPRWLLLPLQPALLAGGDHRTDRQCGLLLYALHGEGSQGCGVLWVIKRNFERFLPMQLQRKGLQPAVGCAF
jgi:hypothetical protein